MPDAFRKPYLDSSVYIAAIKGEGGRADIAKRILTGAQNGEFQVVAGTLVIAEVVGASRRDRPMTPEQEEIVDTYIFHDFIDLVDLDPPTAIEARRLARQHSLKTADSIHLACALRAEADQLLCWDRDFRDDKYGAVEVHEPHLTGLPEVLTNFEKAANAPQEASLE